MTNQAQRGLRSDEPLMIAWNKYKESGEYTNTIKWAGESNIGQLWAAFTAGWLAAGGKIE